LVPAIIKKLHLAIVNNEEQVEIWGDGLARREFMYAGDFAEAIFYSLNNFDDMPQLLNIGVGEDHSINEYYEIISGVLGYEGNFIHDLDKPTGMQKKLVSIKKQTSWGWKPKTELKEGIKKTYDYFLKEIEQ
jgi:GDP-L-fucose synthase